LVALGSLILLVLVFLPTFQRWRESRMGGDFPCPRNLRLIGQAMLLYAVEHDDRPPGSVADLLLYLNPRTFVCPSSNDTVARAGPTTRATEANVFAGHHLSYLILFDKFSRTASDANVVLAYEPPSNHPGIGINVLYGDGHVEFLPAATATKVLAELNAGHNPPRPEKPQ
jgi:prepilin-type processing-associated H-X9-DG protein